MDWIRNLKDLRVLAKILPLIILLWVAFSFLFKPKEQEEVAIKDPKIQEGLAQQVMRGVHLIETRIGGKEWELWSEQAYNLKTNDSWILEKVKIQFFGDNDTKFMVTGSKGTVDMKTKNMKISGSVKIKTSNGFVISTQAVDYYSEQGILKSNSEVVVIGKSKTEEEGPLIVKSKSMETMISNQETQLIGGVTAQKKLRKGQVVNLKSETAVLKGTSYKALFNNNVVADLNQSRVSGGQAIFELNPSTLRAHSVTVKENVRLSDLNRWAVAGEVEMNFPQEKFVLRGNPRVVQNGNELKGHEIIFYNSGEIQVKKAKAKFDKNLGRFQ